MYGDLESARLLQAVQKRVQAMKCVASLARVEKLVFLVTSIIRVYISLNIKNHTDLNLLSLLPTTPKNLKRPMTMPLVLRV